MAKGTATKGFRSVHAKSIKALAWVSLVLATAAGFMLSGTFLADWIDNFFGMFPEPWRTIIRVILVVIGLGALVLDCWLDLEPNQLAVWCALLLPSIAQGLSGGVADWAQDLGRTVLHAIDQLLFKAQPAGLGSTALAFCLAVAVLFMSNRVVKKSRKG